MGGAGGSSVLQADPSAFLSIPMVRYRVWFVGDLPRCSCPNYDKRAGQPVPSPCKHIYAVLDLRLHEVGQSLAAPECKPRKQYAQHPTYTKGSDR